MKWCNRAIAWPIENLTITFTITKLQIDNYKFF